MREGGKIRNYIRKKYFEYLANIYLMRILVVHH